MKRGCPEHWKTELLAQTLGVGLAQAVGHLELLFHFTAKSCPDGDLGRVPARILAARCGWVADTDKAAAHFIDALRASHWLDDGAGGALLVHDWHEHAEDAIHMALGRKGKMFANGERPKLGRLTKAEREEAEKAFAQQVAAKPKRRPAKRTAGVSCAHTVRTAGTQETHCPPLPSPPKPSPDLLPTEACPEPAKPPASGPPALTFPTVGDTKEWHLSEAKLAEYREAFPSLDVLGECRKALQWIRDSPDRRKTAKGMTKFLGGWLGRAQNGAGSRGPPAYANGPAQPDPISEYIRGTKREATR